LAGHNGLKSLKAGFGSPEFARVRVGVGRPDSTDPEIVSAHVLGTWRQSAAEVRELVAAAADELERVVAEP
jgi:PTH1 family peptidyl-tRNA hydrolase